MRKLKLLASGLLVLALGAGAQAADEPATKAKAPTAAPATKVAPKEVTAEKKVVDTKADAKADKADEAKPGPIKAERKKSSGNVKPDAKLAAYKKVSGEVSGTIKSVGSDSMNNLMALWAEGFQKNYPNVQVEIEGKGSSTAPPALISGTANFGPMSREMKKAEIDNFEAKFGYKPTAIATSVDVLAVYVHKDNPIKGLTMQQVDAIFSKTRKAGADEDIKTWGDLGLTGDWKDQPISIYGRNSASGTYGFFKEHALKNGDYKDSVKEQPGSSAVVQGVASDKYAIGYSGIGYKTSDVRAVPLGTSAKKFVEADMDNAYSGDYPMSRFLYVYINYKPGGNLDPLRREFVKYVLSMQGQTDVIDDGYLPLPAKVAEKSLKTVGLSAEASPATKTSSTTTPAKPAAGARTSKPATAVKPSK